MSCKINKSESIFAIKQYIAKEPENMKFHYANILVHANKKDHGPGMRRLNVCINEDEGKVIIEDLHTIFGGCSNIFTTKDSSFVFVTNTLCIKTNDAINGEISINIT